jgi:hypothetical protein
MFIYPLVILYFYNTELKLLLVPESDTVTVTNIAETQQNCWRLREKYGAEAVQLYIYQPANKNKTYKELVAFSTTSKFAPIESTKQIQLISRTRLIEDMRTLGVCRVTATSGHHESAIVSAFNMSEQIIVPVKDGVTGQVIGEVHWLFTNVFTQQVTVLINDSQIFAYNIN